MISLVGAMVKGEAAVHTGPTHSVTNRTKFTLGVGYHGSVPYVYTHWDNKKKKSTQKQSAQDPGRCRNLSAS